jgi:hypothetical protein
MGQNCFVPSFVPSFVSGTKITPSVLSRGQKSHPFWRPSSRGRQDNAVAGQWLLIIGASANHSAAAAASAGDKDDNNNEANKPSPRAGMDADWGGQQRPNDRLALAWRELALSNANAHSGRTTSSNNVTNKGGGAAANAPGRVHRQQSAKKRQQ